MIQTGKIVEIYEISSPDVQNPAMLKGKINQMVQAINQLLEALNQSQPTKETVCKHRSSLNGKCVGCGKKLLESLKFSDLKGTGLGDTSDVVITHNSPQQTLKEKIEEITNHFYGEDISDKDHQEIKAEKILSLVKEHLLSKMKIEAKHDDNDYSWYMYNKLEEILESELS